MRSGAPPEDLARRIRKGERSVERAREQFRRNRKRRTSAALGEEEHAQNRSWPRRVGRSGVAPALHMELAIRISEPHLRVGPLPSTTPPWRSLMVLRVVSLVAPSCLGGALPGQGAAVVLSGVPLLSFSSTSGQPIHTCFGFGLH